MSASATQGGHNSTLIECRIQVAFKLNTVVNAYNVDEDMASQVVELNPVRWKVNHDRYGAWSCVSRPAGDRRILIQSPRRVYG